MILIWVADIFPLDFKYEGFSECSYPVVCIDHEKAVKFDTNQYNETIKYHDGHICAFGTLTMYFSTAGTL